MPYDWVSVLWSVCVEEQFYLIVPLFIALSRAALSSGTRRDALDGGSIGNPVVVRTCERPAANSIVFNTFAQFDTLLSGVLLALLVGWDRDRPSLTQWLRWLQWPLYGVIAWGMSRPDLGRGSVWHRTWDYIWSLALRNRRS